MRTHRKTENEMDVRVYFQKVRQLEATITHEHVVIVSEETSDGGKAGMMSEVSRYIAAKLIVEGRAKLATDEQAKAYSAAEETKREAAQRAEFATKVQVTLVAEPEALIKAGNKGPKS
jgi:hypothetical protein